MVEEERPKEHPMVQEAMDEVPKALDTMDDSNLGRPKVRRPSRVPIVLVDVMRLLFWSLKDLPVCQSSMNQKFVAYLQGNFQLECLQVCRS